MKLAGVEEEVGMAPVVATEVVRGEKEGPRLRIWSIGDQCVCMGGTEYSARLQTVNWNICFVLGIGQEWVTKICSFMRTPLS